MRLITFKRYPGQRFVVEETVNGQIELRTLWTVEQAFKRMTELKSEGFMEIVKSGYTYAYEKEVK